MSHAPPHLQATGEKKVLFPYASVSDLVHAFQIARDEQHSIGTQNIQLLENQIFELYTVKTYCTYIKKGTFSQND